MKELLGEVSRQRDDYAVQLTVKDQQIAELHILLQRALERQPMLELPPADTVAAHSEAPPPSERRRRWWHALVWG